MQAEYAEKQEQGHVVFVRLRPSHMADRRSEPAQPDHASPPSRRRHPACAGRLAALLTRDVLEAAVAAVPADFLDGVGLQEIVWIDGTNRVYAWTVPGTPGSPRLQWRMFRGDAKHTGALTTGP